jgi:hypothetical protein
MLERGDSVPHFDLHSAFGEPFSYGSIWQHHNLVLVTLPTGQAESAQHYTTQIASFLPEFNARNAICVVARGTVAGVAGPGILIADRWGEVVHVEAHDEVADFPPLRELLEWLDYVQIRCPECEGENR